MALPDFSESTVRAALKHYEALFAAGDIEGIAEGYADNVRVRYGSHRPFAGKHRLRAFLAKRFATLRRYRLTKRLEALDPPRFAASWTADWIDAQTGAAMQGFFATAPPRKPISLRT